MLPENSSMILERKREFRDAVHCMFSLLMRSILKILWVFPIKPQKMIFMSFGGKQYSCNPKYLTEYLLTHYRGKYQIIWAIDNPGKVSIQGVRFVKLRSLRHFYHFCTAKVIIDNCGLPSYMPKRRNQVMVNTWHGGGAYKKDEPETYFSRALQHYKSRKTDIVLSSSRAFSEQPLRHLVLDYQGEILPCGMPRNDILFLGERDSVRKKVCRILDIDTKKCIVLFAPTFRGQFTLRASLNNYFSVRGFSTNLDVEGLKRAVRKRFGRECEFIYRAHHIMKFQTEFSLGVSATDYPDMQELLCAADILISDYSSTIWDYALTKKPCFLFVPDMDYYLQADRGTYTPIETWPGIIAKNNEELQEKILGFQEDAYKEKVEKYLRDMGSYETGTACEQTYNRIAEICRLK